MTILGQPSGNTVPPVIGITMGCPVGIGPEIILRLLVKPESLPGVTPVVLGDSTVLRWCAQELGLPVAIVPWQPGMRPRPATVAVVELSQLVGNDADSDSLHWGKPDRRTGLAMARYIEEAVRLCRAGELAAMVTCPIAKSTLAQAGYPFPGHTEMLANLCGVKNYGMMMAGHRLRVTLVTIHIPLAEVPSRLSQEEIFRVIGLTYSSLQRDFAIARPRLVVAGLNPHAGEAGRFGSEERMIGAAVETAVDQGWNVTGPLPPDTVFTKAVAGEYDAVVCMYHDQGLIPFKLLHFADGVNVTMGLPIIRTSVDHGTAYDIAGKGFANPASLAAAVRMAAVIATNRERDDHAAG